jgi:hypothetical protein
MQMFPIMAATIVKARLLDDNLVSGTAVEALVETSP